MAIFLRAIHGPLKDQEFDVFGGLIMGREEGNIILEDPKASSRHALIKKTFSGRYVLYDQKSKNGIKVDGKRVDKVALEPGLSFQIGDNVFVVEEEGAVQSGPPDREESDLPDENGAPSDESDGKSLSGLTATEVNSPAKENKSPPQPTVSLRPVRSPAKIDEEEVEGRQTWNQVLEEFCRKMAPNIQDQTQPLQAFSPIVVLTVFRGLQAETEWELGYGPRVAGKTSLDLPIYEPEAPHGDCFTIIPSEGRPLFKTRFPEQVKVNGQAVTKTLLKSGDVISIYETQIEVNLA